MLKFCSLYSGSTGNSLFVQNNDTNILIDAGVSCKKIIEALASINVSINDIDAILITHEHTDHIKSLDALSSKYSIPVYANERTWKAMEKQVTRISNENRNIFEASEKFNVKDIEVLPFSIPHDAADPCGFNIFGSNQKISIATDIGHIDSNIFKKLENSSFVLLESNYDPEILKCCSYPYKLKQRILGPNGHLPNNEAGITISRLIDTGLKQVMLGHLSKENNFPELAQKTVLEELYSRNYTENSVLLSVASRFEPSKLIDIA